MQKTPGSAVIVTLELSHDAIPSVAVITFWISSGKSSVHAFTNLQITCAEAALGPCNYMSNAVVISLFSPKPDAVRLWLPRINRDFRRPNRKMNFG